MPTVASGNTQARAVVANSTSRHRERSATNDGLRNKRRPAVAAEGRNECYLPSHPWKKDEASRAAPRPIARRVLRRVERERGFHEA